MVPEIGVRQNFLSFWIIFCLFTPSPLMIHEIKILAKNEKKCLEILSFYIYMCTINEDRMIYGSWNIRWYRQKFLSFCAISCPFSPLTTKKIKILRLKRKKIHFINFINLYILTINDNHMMYGSWDIEREGQNFCHFRQFFALLTPLKTKKIKILKK